MFPRYEGLRAIEFGTPGEFREELNALIVAGTKTATIGHPHDYISEGEEPETVGERVAVLDSDGRLVTHIVITDIALVPFTEIDDDFARACGEGHRDADHLRAGYTRYWADAGLTVEPDELVYAIRFALSDG
ncbi:ASCH domain-containing protein [Herbiconiux sp. KACC 21604]|uniref:ASCH domain-containing protein n=1 Tax=unclassified Herbiconiux TaxID=2618217 RepID=UPI001492CC4B|nr:ASCH domain-containing protein [Herbiconiux sp. SALV-R1]QJU55092.1 ASCH domain-containing protein [Herbiconiux sp. SALV-R1]WPO86239.1 ASCH domain-containing protein [Herbiconiux sp. KACC 21604]